MKKLLPLMLLTAFTTLAVQASPEVVGDDACFIVSGAKWDHNNAFYRLSISERTNRIHSFAGYSCRVFDSYTALKSHLATSRIEKHAPILVVQMAHGGSGGTAHINSGHISGDQINKELRDLSVNYKVAYLNQSCYGGDLIPKKLNWDQANPTSPTIDRTCVMTDSVPGRVAFARDNVPRFKEDYTLEDSYTKNPTGLVSSSAWSTVKMGEFHYAQSQLPGFALRKPEIAQKIYPLVSRFVRGLNSIIEEYGPKDSLTKTITNNALLVLDPAATDSVVKGLLKAPRGSSFQALEPIRQAIFFPPVSENACTLAVRKFIVSQWYLVFTNNTSDQWGQFQANLKEQLKDYPGVADSCSDVGQSNKSISDWSAWVSEHSPIGEIMKEKTSAIASIELKSGSYIREITFEESLSKANTILSIIGREILPEESANMDLGSFKSLVGYPNLRVHGATGNVMPAFNLASFNMPEYTNSLDERRRNACRNIQLKAW